MLLNGYQSNNKRGTKKSKKGKKENSGSCNEGNKDLSHIKCFMCQKFGHFASNVIKIRGRVSNNARSNLQGVQENHLKWMSFHPILRCTSERCHAYHLTSCLMLTGMWIVEPANIQPLTRVTLEELGDDAMYRVARVGHSMPPSLISSSRKVQSRE